MRCLYWLAESSAQNLSSAAAVGFQCIDSWLEFARALPLTDLPAPSPRIRPSLPTDLGPLRDPARKTLRDTRFTQNLNFPAALATELYAKWIERDAELNLVKVAIAPDSETPVGFISFRRPDDAGRSEIELLAVSASHAGLGLGRELTNAALAHATAPRAPRMTVVTRGANIGAQRVYQHCGFRSTCAIRWHHRWLLTASMDDFVPFNRSDLMGRELD